MKKVLYSLILIISIVAPQTMQASWSNYTIVLDPGHGGDDPGAVYSGSSVDNYTEAWLALQCASNVYNHLSRAGANVYMTRWENDFYGEVGLSTRRAYCYTYDSDVFISFHLNAANASAHGTETWYYYDGSYNLASCVQSGLMYTFDTVDGLGGYEKIDRGIKNNGWTVITAGEYYPAVLTEGLFVDCYTDWQLIQDVTSTGFNAWADGHIKGIYDYLNYYGYYRVSEPTYNGAGSSSASTDPYISVSSNKVYLTCVAGQSAKAEVVVSGEKLNRWTTITMSSKCTGVFSAAAEDGRNGLNVSGSTNTFDPEDPKIIITFTPSKAGNYSGDGDGDGYEDYVITLESVGTDGEPVYQWITLNGVASEPPLSLNEGWVLSENANNLAANGWDASKVRNMEVRDGKIYAVYEQSKIKVIDAYTGQALYDLSSEGIAGGIIKLCDVRYFDGKVIASNLGGIDAAGNTHDLRIYIWDNPASSTTAPRVVTISYATLQEYNITRLGDYIGVGGDWDTTDGSRIIFAYNNLNKVSGVTGGTYIIEFPVANNTIGTTPSKHIQVTADGENLYAGESLRAYPTGYGYMFDGSQCAPTKLDSNGARLDYMDGYKTWGNVYRQFEHNGVTYGATLDFNDKIFSTKDDSGNPAQNDDDKAKNYTGGFMRLLQITDKNNSGTFRAPINVAEYPKAHLADSTRNTNCTGNIVINQKADGTVEAWVLSTGQGIGYFTSSDAPVVATPSISVDNTSATFTATVGGSNKATINVNGHNLTGDITATLSGSDADLFSLSTNKLSASGTITVTYSPTAEGTHTAALTLSSTGANDVTVSLTGTASSSSSVEITGYKLSQNWVKTTGHVAPSSAGRGWSTGFDGKIYFNDDANTTLKYWDKDGLHTAVASVSSTAITSDEAGNIILSASMWSTSANTFKVLPKGSTTWQDLSITLPDGVSAAATKYIGKAIGNILSADGGVICIIPTGATKVAKVTVANGAFKSSKAIDVSSAINSTADAEVFAMPLTSDINSDVIAVRDHRKNHFYHNTKGTFEAFADNGITSTRGGTIFKLGDKQFAVEPIGALDCDGFQIVNLTDNSIEATHTTAYSSSGTPNCITAEVVDKYTVKLYQYVPGIVAAQYTFEAVRSTGVDEVDGAEIDAEAPVEYYNLQGVRVNSENLTPGIYIRRQGNTVGKVLVK